MFKKPFFSFGSPRLKYPVIQEFNPEFDKDVTLPDTVTVYLKGPFSPVDKNILKKGDGVKTGQRVLIDNDDSYFISPVSGEVSEIGELIGYLGVIYTSISIKTDPEEQTDEEFKSITDAISPENAVKYLGSLPGCPDFGSFIKREEPFNTIVIEGADNDLLVTANQVVLANRAEDVREGIKILKELTGVDNIIITAFPGSSFTAGDEGERLAVINPVYPEALHEVIMKKVLKKIVPAGKKSEDLGVGFIKAEAVAALAAAFGRGEAPIEKIVTVVDKSGLIKNMKVRTGTPVRHILEKLNIRTDQGDRIVFGGLLKGKSVYTEEAPVLADTDAVIVQARADIIPTLDNPCINCGECVRVCPAGIPVNMLVRLLENSLYEDAVREYDLLSCIECGLCAYVCVAQMPIFHYIMLGKNEYLKLNSMEESNA